MASSSRVRTQTKAAARRALKAKGDDPKIRAEDMGFTPLMPQNLLTPGQYAADWLGDKLNVYTKARKLLETDDFVGGVHAIKLAYFNDGFRLSSGSSTDTAMLAESTYPLARAALDVWTEWLLQDNVVAFWMKPAPDADKPPFVVVLDTEICQYSNRLGVETLSVKLPQGKLTPAQAAALGPRWTEAYKKGTAITLDPERGECFKVLTRAKLGNGLGVPRLKQILTRLSTYDLLRSGDWNGAWLAKNVIRHFKKGHEIKTGDRAGYATHFLTVKQANKLAASIKDKTGPFDLISNFDLDVAYQFLPATFFDKKKFEGVQEQLNLWAGPAALLREAGTLSPNLMDLFEVEGMANRAMVGGFLEELFNDPNFRPAGARWPESERIRVKFNPRTFLNTKLALEWVRVAVTNGLAAPQTGSEALGLDSAEEAAKITEARKTPLNFTPVFEAKQGMLNTDGGRPSTDANAQTPPTGGG